MWPVALFIRGPIRLPFYHFKHFIVLTDFTNLLFAATPYRFRLYHFTIRVAILVSLLVLPLYHPFARPCRFYHFTNFTILPT